MYAAGRVGSRSARRLRPFLPGRTSDEIRQSLDRTSRALGKGPREFNHLLQVLRGPRHIS